MRLPEHAQALFDDVLPVFLEFFSRDQILLGGGTALAARWQHRVSFDIALVIHPVHYHQMLLNHRDRFERRLGELAAGQGAAVLHGDSTIYCSSGKVDILSVLPLTPDSSSGEYTADTGIELESNLEILAKKLHLRIFEQHRLFPRDLYDFAYARQFLPNLMDRVWRAFPIRTSRTVMAKLSGLEDDWILTHPEPVVDPRYPGLRDLAVRDMIEDMKTRFS